MTIKTLKLEDLDCAHCAAEIETAVNKLKNVKATVSFMTQKMTLEFEEGCFDDVLKDVKKIVGKIEPDVTVGVE